MLDKIPYRIAQLAVRVIERGQCSYALSIRFFSQHCSQVNLPAFLAKVVRIFGVPLIVQELMEADLFRVAIGS